MNKNKITIGLISAIVISALLIQINNPQIVEQFVITGPNVNWMNLVN